MRKDDGFAENAVAIDVSVASQTLPLGSRGLYVGATGAVSVEMWDGAVVTFTGVPAGALLPIRARTVLNPATTATGIIALI